MAVASGKALGGTASLHVRHACARAYTRGRGKQVLETVPPSDCCLPLQRLFFCCKGYDQPVLLVFFLAKPASAYALLETW
jgi:hypothetical protein